MPKIYGWLISADFTIWRGGLEIYSHKKWIPNGNEKCKKWQRKENTKDKKFEDEIEEEKKGVEQERENNESLRTRQREIDENWIERNRGKWIKNLVWFGFLAYQPL